MTETNLRNDFSSMSNTPMEIDNNKRPFQAVNDMSSETTTLNEPKLTQNDDGLFTPRGSTAVAAVAAPVITQEPEPAPPHNPTNTAYYYDTYYSTDDADTVQQNNKGKKSEKAVSLLLPPDLHRIQLPSQGFFDKETSTISLPSDMQIILSPPPGFPALAAHPPLYSETTSLDTANGAIVGSAFHQSFFPTSIPYIPTTKSSNNTNHTITGNHDQLQQLDGHNSPHWQIIQERHFTTFSSKHIMKRWITWWIHKLFYLAWDQWELCIGG